MIPITGLDPKGLNERLKFLHGIAEPETRIDYDVVKVGPPSIETHADAVFAGPEILRLVKKAEDESCDAVIIWCGGDPSLEAARELVDIVVIGPGEAMRSIASVLGKKPCKITPNIPVLEMRRNLTRIVSVLEEMIRDKIAKDEGDVFYLGCLALWGLGDTLRESLGVPILDGAECALKTAETIVNLRLSHSRIAYPKSIC
ncbi:MAG: aspartate/glutamate racemase family protein [Promethearchaeota archaeon]